MGLGLAALAALLILLPGFCFTVGWGRLPSASSPSTAIDQQLSFGLLVSLAAALVAHLVFLTLAHLLAYCTGLHPNPALVLPLLAGDVEHGTAAVASVKEHFLAIAWYFVAASFLSWFAGRVINKAVPPRRSAGDWHTLLREPGVDFVVLTVDARIDDTCFLYKGILDDFHVGPTGQLERVVLAYATRRVFGTANAKVAPSGYVLADGWVEIPGEFFVLHPSESATINVDYFYVDPEGIDAGDVEEEPPSPPPVLYLGVDEEGLGG